MFNVEILHLLPRLFCQRKLIGIKVPVFCCDVALWRAFGSLFVLKSTTSQWRLMILMMSTGSLPMQWQHVTLKSLSSTTGLPVTSTSRLNISTLDTFLITIKHLHWHAIELEVSELSAYSIVLLTLDRDNRPSAQLPLSASSVIGQPLANNHEP